MKKLLIIIEVALMGTVLASCGPHVQTDQQVLERFPWKLKTSNNIKGKATFTKSTMKVGNKKYKYSLNDNSSTDKLVIKNGNLKGHYRMNDDATDYVLKNENSKQEPKKIHLIRNEK